MLRSMTAFASAERTTPLGVLSCELRSVNHRYLELSPRLPEELRAFESTLRERIAAKLSRGKVDVSLRLRSETATMNSLQINEGLLNWAMWRNACKVVSPISTPISSACSTSKACW